MNRRLAIAVTCAVQILVSTGCYRIPDIESDAISRLSSRQSYAEIDWAPDGDRLIAVGLPAPPGVEAALYLVDARTGRHEVVSERPDWYSHPRWSPDGTKIAITLGLSEIWILDLVTDNMTFIGEGEGAAWSPTADRLAIYVGETIDRTRSTQEVRILAADGSLLGLYDLDYSNNPGWRSDLTEESSVVGQYLKGITWSPLFDQIGFSLYTLLPEHVRTSEAFVLDTLSSEIEPYAAAQPIGRFDWSPNGSYVAYVLADVYDWGYLVIEDYMGNCVFAPDIPPKVRDLAWSPDGDSLAFLFDNSIHIAYIDQIPQHPQPLARCP